MLLYTDTNYDYSGRRRKRTLRAKRRPTPLSSFVPLKSSTSPFVQALMDRNKAIPSGNMDVDMSHMKKKETERYTGDELLGIATMHKSNAVPVSKRTDAKIFATMRRS